jgi:hypothetical protein
VGQRAIKFSCVVENRKFRGGKRDAVVLGYILKQFVMVGDIAGVAL